MTNSIKRTSIFIMVVALICAFSMPIGNINAEAKSKKVRTVTTKTANPKKAKALRKGTTKVVNKGSWVIVKFKAPKTKTYKLTFYNVNAVRKADKKRNSVNGSVQLSYLNKYGLQPIKAKTNYGKAWFLQLASKNFYKSWYKWQKKSAKKKYNSYLLKRYATVKLKKGKAVYIKCYFAGVKNNNSSYYVNIK